MLICWVMLGVFALGYCEASHDTHECPGMYLKDCICHISGSSDFPRVTKLIYSRQASSHTHRVCVCVCILVSQQQQPQLLVCPIFIAIGDLEE